MKSIPKTCQYIIMHIKARFIKLSHRVNESSSNKQMHIMCNTSIIHYDYQSDLLFVYFIDLIV